METPNDIEDVATSPRKDTDTSHWLPAMRPDSLDETDDSSATSHAKTDIIHPTSISQHDGRDEVQRNSIAVVAEEPEELPEPTKSSIGDGLNTVSSPQPLDTVTADDELPSEDDDERLDPAWGIKRFDTSRLLDGVQRTSTFPDLSQPSLTNEQPGVDALVPEPETEIVNGTAEVERVVEQDKTATEPYTMDWEDGEDTATREPQSWTVPAAEDPLDEAAGRYEEGLPLIQPEQESPSDDDEDDLKPLKEELFDNVQDGRATSYFPDVYGPAAPIPEVSTLDRKSTAQVLNSLHLSEKDPLDTPAVHVPAEASFFDQLATTDISDANIQSAPMADKQDTNDLWAAALEDDEFLVEDADDLLPDSDEESSAMAPAQPPSHTMPQHPPRRQSSMNPYAPHQPSTADMFQMPPTGRTTYNNVGLSRPELPPASSFQAQLPGRPTVQSVRSFVDQAKDGYKSPYDLPMDLKPKRKAHVPQPVQTTRAVAPPPRSSSLSEKPFQSPYTPMGPPISGSTSAMQPPAPSSAMPPRSYSAIAPSNTETPKSGSSSGFFEELPVTVKPRPSGRFTPQQSMSATFSPSITQSPPTASLSSPPFLGQQAGQQQPPPSRPADPYSQYQLQAPDRIEPYANVPLQPPPTMAAATASRYSPAPPSSATGTLGPRPGPSPRYSPAPPPQTAPTNASRYTAQPTAPAQAPPVMPNRTFSQTPPSIVGLPFQPRTSSPLVYNQDTVPEHTNESAATMAQAAGSVTSHDPSNQVAVSVPYANASPRKGGYGDLGNQVSPPKNPTSNPLPPPRRSQTQSPSKQRAQVPFPVRNNDLINRPATAYGQASSSIVSQQPKSVSTNRPSFQANGLGSGLEFIRPQDENQLDPLERWKGAPVFKFGFGGSTASTFPQHVPRYTAGMARPQIKSAPGEVHVRNSKEHLPQSDLGANFPGPLRSKSKKKDVLSWMSSYITEMEAGMPNVFAAQAHNDPARRLHEKVLLWKVVRTMVEHDGSLDGLALKAVNHILSPEVHNVDESSPIQYRAGEQSAGIYQPSGANVRPDSIDPMAVEALRKHLLTGDRQGAVFHAMDNRLWSHALIVASTMERSMWGQVVREFVRQEVKPAGENTESLSALYEVFGGNLEESIDELVPPSARAGLQMISRVDPTASGKNALDGLNRWKETLSLVLNNRSQGDHQALAALGKLLQDYGRIEAAHLCFLFSKNPQKPLLFGGPDEEQASIVLLGANHKAQPFDFERDQDAIVLTEIYEFATGVLATGSTVPFMPHLSVFKLRRATLMSEMGQKAEAQAYCDAIAATFGKGNKMSPYYHSVFLSELDDLSNKLKQTPISGSSSWIGKPSLEKVGGSMWTKFSSFVAGGEDSDAESKGSGKDAVEAGPFARIAGTPSVSRVGSQSDLYGSSYPQAALPALAGSKYAPNGLQSTRSSAELPRGRPSLDSQRSPPSTSYSQTNHQYEPMNMFQQGQLATPPNPYQALAGASPPTSYPQSPPRSSYMPNNTAQAPVSSLPPARPEYVPTPPSEDVIHQPYGYGPNSFAQIPEEQPISFGGYQPMDDQPVQQAREDGHRGTGYEAPAQSYGYEAPTGGYVPYVPEPDSPEVPSKGAQPKKKSFMDDEDDDFRRHSNRSQDHQSQPSTDADATTRKRANDAAADAAFRAAAEADAARAKDQKQSKRSSSWLGGWFAGKKDEGLDASSAGKGGDQKVFRAKLGESKMKLYYDKELGKWINPDKPDGPAKSATPPPPRMGGTPAPPMGPPRPPMRSVASSSNPGTPALGMGLASGPPSRTGTPADGPGPTLISGHSPQGGTTGPPSGAGTPPIGRPSTPGLPPPPRPSTDMSNASSIDDLIGPSTGRKPAKGARKGGKGRYVDVMAQ